MAATDADRDGLSDELEQALLQKFAPVFHVSVEDCDLLPSEFASGRLEPISIARNGTIYGQVFPIRRDGRALVELHYYHLWRKDCGRLSHPLDAEHVSGLLEADSLDSPATKWRATYWYAAAHQDTVCDSGNGARASAISAVVRGPAVWISKDKHASYLSLELCRRGCGGDRCDSHERFDPPRIVNVGERNALVNGAVWVTSRRWNLPRKLESDFTEPILRALASAPTSGGPVSLTIPMILVQSVLYGGGAAIKGVSTGGRHTGAALTPADFHTSGALARAERSASWALSKIAGSIDLSLRRAQSATKAAAKTALRSIW